LFRQRENKIMGLLNTNLESKDEEKNIPSPANKHKSLTMVPL
jgi:hypothetical protein